VAIESRMDLFEHEAVSQSLRTQQRP
jgi:hypothetical protein